MKIDRYSPLSLLAGVKHGFLLGDWLRNSGAAVSRNKPAAQRDCLSVRLTARPTHLFCCTLLQIVLLASPAALGVAETTTIVSGGQITAGVPPEQSLPTIKSNERRPDRAETPKPIRTSSQRKAVAILRRTIDRLANGPAFNAKVRQRVWTEGREVVGVGTYEQAGSGSGRFNLQLTMHDGDGKHSLQQISDGRLAWTRTVIADEVSLRRVDVGRLDEWVLGSVPSERVPPRLKVGAWTELLDSIERDHVLGLGTSRLQSRRVVVLTGKLRDEVRGRVHEKLKEDEWPPLYPTEVKVAIAAEPDPETGFGEGLPLRIEFWSDAVSEPTDPVRDAKPLDPRGKARLVALIEIYSIRPMAPSPLERFRFENRESEVNFVNETDRYLKLYGVRITERQRRLLLR